MTDLYEIRQESSDLKGLIRELASMVTKASQAAKVAKADLTVGMASARAKSDKGTVQAREDDAVLANVDLIREEAKAEGYYEGMKIQAKLYPALATLLSAEMGSIKEEMRFTSG